MLIFYVHEIDNVIGAWRILGEYDFAPAGLAPGEVWVTVEEWFVVP